MKSASMRLGAADGWHLLAPSLVPTGGVLPRVWASKLCIFQTNLRLLHEQTACTPKM